MVGDILKPTHLRTVELSGLGLCTVI